MRVLVVEDDDDLARQLRDCLVDAGYVIDVAPDGEEGHYLGANEPYDAIVLDLGLPVMYGITVFESWRRDGCTKPVLILIARDRWSEEVAGFASGADDYVAKPGSTWRRCWQTSPSSMRTSPMLRPMRKAMRSAPPDARRRPSGSRQRTR